VRLRLEGEAALVAEGGAEAREVVVAAGHAAEAGEDSELEVPLSR